MAPFFQLLRTKTRMAISAKDVKELRDRTGAGMMECKGALEETGGDMEKAIDVLRAKGAAKAAQAAGEPLACAVLAWLTRRLSGCRCDAACVCGATQSRRKVSRWLLR